MSEIHACGIIQIACIVSGKSYRDSITSGTAAGLPCEVEYGDMVPMTGASPALQRVQIHLACDRVDRTGVVRLEIGGLEIIVGFRDVICGVDHGECGVQAEHMTIYGGSRTIEVKRVAFGGNLWSCCLTACWITMQYGGGISG